MKKLLFSAAAIAILSAPAAFADDNDNNDRQGQHEKANRDSSGPDRSTDKGNKPDGAGGGAMMSDGPKNAGGNAMMSHDGNANDDNGRNKNNDNDRVRGNDNDNNNNRTVIKNNDNDKTVIRKNDNDKTVINKTVVRKTVDRSTVLKFRANIRAPHRYHFARAYVRPVGFYPHRWVFGERLPRAFFAPDFFILDFSAYGLIEPWSGYEWVRYGDDALLIDVETGEVIRTEYDAFY